MTTEYLSAQALSKRFDHKPVLRDINLTVKPGDIVGLLGANGAGKTTLIELLLGYSLPTTGRASAFGTDAVHMPAEAKARIGFVPQVDELMPTMTAGQYLALIGSFYPAWDAAYADSLVEKWGIDRRELIRKSSQGQRQKLSLVAALAHRPDLIVLDEPVASLDPIARRLFLQQIIETTADGNRAVVFSSHIVSDVERLANVIWILKDGQLLWQGELDALKDSVVRIHVPESAASQARVTLRNVLADRVATSGQRKLIALRAPDEDWSALETRLGADARVEQLGLEDIFVELHS